MQIRCAPQHLAELTHFAIERRVQEFGALSSETSEGQDMIRGLKVCVLRHPYSNQLRALFVVGPPSHIDRELGSVRFAFVTGHFVHVVCCSLRVKTRALSSTMV